MTSFNHLKNLFFAALFGAVVFFAPATFADDSGGGGGGFGGFKPDAFKPDMAKNLLANKGGGQKDIEEKDYRRYGIRNYFYVGLQAGMVNYAQPGDETLDESEHTDGATFPFVNTQLKSGFVGGLNAGYQLTTEHEFFFPAYRFGVSANYFGGAKLNGEYYYLFENPDTLNSYQASVSSQVLFLTAEADIFKWGPVRPFVLVGVGGARNVLSSYQLTGPQAGIFAIDGQSQMGLAYEAGLGVSYYFTERLSASISYVYSNLGTVTSKPVTWQVGDKPIALGSLSYSLSNSEYLLGVRYLI